MYRDDAVRLRHMLDYCRRAVAFTRGKTRADLDHDEMLVMAVTRAVEVVGEAASQVSAEYREQHTEIPWPSIVGMRNRLIHAYFDINHDVLWTTVGEDLPNLITSLEHLVDKTSGTE